MHTHTTRSALRALVLHTNCLMQLPDSVTRLTGLRSLALSSNRLWQLPTALGAMVALRLLDVSHNMLTRLPSSLGDLEQLRCLKVGAGLCMLHTRAGCSVPLGSPPLSPQRVSRCCSAAAAALYGWRTKATYTLRHPHTIAIPGDPQSAAGAAAGARAADWAGGAAHGRQCGHGESVYIVVENNNRCIAGAE